jgi:hypothetical protein
MLQSRMHASQPAKKGDCHGNGQQDAAEMKRSHKGETQRPELHG